MGDTCMQWVAGNISADFKHALKLRNEESLSDPANEPFKSLLAARALLCEIKDKFKSYNPSTEEDVQYAKILDACICLQLGMNYIEGEETASGQKALETCLTLLEDVPDKNKTASVSIECYNQLGVMWGNRDAHQKALELLLKAATVYETNRATPPMAAEQWLLGNAGSELDRSKLLEDLHTHTLFYLAQVYGHTGQPQLSAQHCRDTLGRQLRANQFDSVEWTLNCATLSQYYLGASNFLQARHCLACSARVLQSLLDKGMAASSEDEVDKLRRTEADLSRCWCKYAISLLQASWERPDGFDPHPQIFRFESLDVDDAESSITAQLVKDYEAAKSVFLFGTKHFDAAKQYYSKDTHATDYAALVQDHSSLFKGLSYFEPSDALKCRMHKRRIDMLTDIIRDLNPAHYLVLSRQLMHELAGAYSEMADLKIVIASDSPSPQQIVKINKLITQSVNWYRKFYDTFVDSNTGTLQADTDNLRSILCARLYMAKLITKVITPDAAAQVSALQEALEHYEWLVNYCDSHPERVSDVFCEELAICRDMVTLLPSRIATLT